MVDNWSEHVTETRTFLEKRQDRFYTFIEGSEFDPVRYFGTVILFFEAEIRLTYKELIVKLTPEQELDALKRTKEWYKVHGYELPPDCSIHEDRLKKKLQSE